MKCPFCTWEEELANCQPKAPCPHLVFVLDNAEEIKYWAAPAFAGAEAEHADTLFDWTCGGNWPDCFVAEGEEGDLEEADEEEDEEYQYRERREVTALFVSDQNRANALNLFLPLNPEGSALLSAVEQNPSDKSVRLVFADWLEEHGDSRASSVREDDHFHEADFPVRKLAPPQNQPQKASRKRSSRIPLPVPSIPEFQYLCGTSNRRGFMNVAKRLGFPRSRVRALWHGNAVPTAAEQQRIVEVAKQVNVLAR